MNEKTYNEEGYLIVSESDRCPLWEKTSRHCAFGHMEDCFFCEFADFRTPEYIDRVEGVPRNGSKWYSVCHNEKNRTAKEI